MVFSITSCTKENNEDDGTPKNWTNPNGQSNPGVTEDMTVLSNQKPNPYNIDTMKHASRIVRGSDAEIQTNFLYIRFEPADLDELQLLEDDSTLFLSDTPLDYEFSIEGTYYHDPNISDEDPTYYYCVIGVNQATPNVSYTTLDDLYIPNIDTESDIECEALDLCNINYTTGSNKGMFRTEPNGQITVTTDGGTNVGVNRVKVIAYNWFRFRSTYTDTYGNFSFNTKFRRARIKVKFISSKADMRFARDINIYRMLTTYKTKIKNGSSYVFVNNDLSNISFNFDHYSDLSTKGCENWHCAVVWNSIYEGHKYANQMGISTPPNGLVVYLTSYLAEGAAPMLNKMGQSGYNIAQLAVKLEFIQKYYFIAAEAIAPSLSITMLAVLQKETPDIVIGMDQSIFKDVERMTIHELGHSIHYLKAGNAFWEDEIDYTVDNEGYGSKSSANSGICALTESWGNYFEEYVCMLKYDGNSHALAQYIENMTGGGGYYWFPSGMYWDIYDDENTLPGFLTENPSITDNVSGITIPALYNLFPGCNNINDFKVKLKLNYPSQQTQIETLFDGYGY